MVSDYGVQYEGGVHSPCLPHDHLLFYSTISKMTNLFTFVSPWHLCQESADHVYVGLLWAVILFTRFECLHLPHFTVPAGTSLNQIVRVLYVIWSILGPLHLCLHFKIRLFISTLHKLGDSDGHCVDSVDHYAGSRTRSWAHPTCQQCSQFLWPSFTQPSRHVVSGGRAHHFATLCSAVWISCITANDTVFWNVFITIVFYCLLKVILKLSVGNPEKSSWFLCTDQNLQSW